MNIEQKQQISKTTVIVTGLYLLAVMVSFLIMFATVDDTAMSGIFLIFITMPWSLVLTWIQNILQFDSTMVNALFLLAGGLFNSFIIYKLFTILANMFKR